MTSLHGNILRVTGPFGGWGCGGGVGGEPPLTSGFPKQRPVTQSFVFFFWPTSEQTV